jgi:hypothetical protein
MAQAMFSDQTYFNNLSYKLIECNSITKSFQEKSLDIQNNEQWYLKKISMTFKILLAIVK